jgi:hypothetical protein
MPSLIEILNDPNYINANPATKKAIFDKYSVQDQNYTGANDATKNAIRQKFGVIEAPLEKETPKERTWGEAATDVGAGLVSGAGSLAQLPGQLYGLATGDFSDTGLTRVGRELKETGESMKSEELKRREAERSTKIAAAEKEGQISAGVTAFMETVKDPALLTNFIAEQVPNLIPALSVARGLKAAGMGAQAVRGAIGTGAAQQGADVGAQAYEELYKELKSKNMSDEEAAGRALGYARATGATGAVISLLAQRLPGAKAIEEAMAGVEGKTVTGILGKAGRAGRAAVGAGGEMASEVTEETGGKLAQNIAVAQERPGYDITTGLGQTAGMAAVGGVGMGGVSGALQGTAKETTEPTRAVRGSELIERQIAVLNQQEKTPEIDAQIVDLTNKLQQVKQEEVKIDQFKSEFSQMEPAQLEEAIKTLQQEQKNREELLQNPELVKEYATEQNIDPVEAQNQLETLFAENQIKQRAYQEFMQEQQAVQTAGGTEGVDLSNIPVAQMTQEQVNAVMSRANPELAQAYKDGNISVENAIKIINKSGENPALQNIGMELIKNRDAEVVENMLEILKRESIDKGNVKETMDNMDFMNDIEKIAQRSIDEQNEIKKDIAALEEGQVKVAEKYGIDPESQDDIDQMISALMYELEGLQNLSEYTDTYERLRDEIAATRTKDQIEQKNKEKEQHEFSNVPDDILEKIEAHSFGKKLDSKLTKAGDFDVDVRNNKISNAVINQDTEAVSAELLKSDNPFYKFIGGKIKNLNTTIQAGFEKHRSRKRAIGYYHQYQDRIYMNKSYTGRTKTVVHEFVHALTYWAVNNPTDAQKPTVKKLEAIFKHVKKELAKKGKTAKQIYGLTNLDEFLAEANSNVNFQYELARIKYKNETAWGAFTRTIANLLGVANVSALTEVIALTEELTSDASTKGTTTNAPVAADIFGKKKPKPSTATSTNAATGQSAVNSINQIGRSVKPPSPSYVQRIQSGWKQASQNPQLTKQSAAQAFKKFTDKVETMVFSSDAALNNEIRRTIMASSMGIQDKIGAMLEVSLSQTMHADAVASLHLMEGKVVYDSKNYKWKSEKTDANLVTLAKQIDKLAEKYGRTKEEAAMIAHTAFEAKRLNSLAKEKAAIEAKVNILRTEARNLTQQADAAEQAGKMDEAENKRNKAAKKRAEALKEKAKGKVIHMTPSQIQAGLDLFKTMPELNDLVDTWQEMRKNTADVLVESGLWSREDAEFLLENIDYVPFFREEQIEQGKGPKEFIRGLQVQARDPRMKGSMKPVNDIFDNMARWMQYSVNRSVRNKSALSLIDAAVDNGLGRKISRLKRGGNNINVWRNGKKEFYELDDPMWVDAFRGLESVAIPALNVFSKMANLLRQSVVMYPLFSVAQIPQDSFAAMFSSGLKPQFALRIPVYAVKEFLKTLTKRSQTHNDLRKYAAVGVKDFSSAVARLDAQVTAGIKAPSGVVGKLKAGLTHFAMSADNAVRQAVYEASIDAGKTQAEALEKAFQIINFRNRGSSKSLALAGQVIPFFNAYLAAQHVAYKTITGVGISPDERKAALGTLVATTGSVMAMALIYSMMNADDDDYKNKPAAVRDRLLMIPGTGGLAVPLRMDLFTFPKVLTEHMYLLMTDKGYEDGRKMRDSMKNALANALFSPTLVPQAVKPLIEVGINYDFFQGRPLIGTFQKQLETERQFTDSTSELGKIFGSTGLVSPIAADHLIRGMFGSVGGLVLYMTNPLLHNDPSTERPSLSARDALAALPGTSGFVSREYETALKTDFYVLRDEVAKVVNTINDMKTRSPDEIDKYLEKEGVEEKYALKGAMNKITERLTKIRKAITQVTNDTDMTGKEKQEYIRELRQTERDLLESIDVKDLRKEAKL